ncbi:MAG TPA: AAA family ATPase [Candidatus Faecousia faecavium]|nr:AAA family ATPase [Candidatus Faecousia faecavium]
MKTLYLIGGTMGVGKTTVCRELKNQLPRSVFLDGDWCWDMNPFVVTEETKAMVLDNITTLLKNFLRCSAYDHVIFCWVMHQQAILDQILSRLDLTDVTVVPVSLVCSQEVLLQRLNQDVSASLRQPDILLRSPQRLPLYDALDTHKIDTSYAAVPEIVQAILRLSKNGI